MRKIKPLMSSSVAFVGVGQAGGNIAKEFKDLGYTTYYINTSAVDLQTIDADKNYKYQVPMAQGCSKNRDLAKKYTKEYYDTIVGQVKSKLGNFSHIFFCFSMGGGTGSGITPMLVNSLVNKIPDISFGIIAAIPELSESSKMKHNAMSCFTEIEGIIGLGNIYFIANENRKREGRIISYEELNKGFANKIHDFLSITNSDKKGTTDESEVLTLLKMEGNTVIADLLGGGATDKFNLPPITIEPTLAKSKKGCLYLAYSLINDEDFIQGKVEDVFGTPSDYFKGYNDKKSFVVAFGLPLPSETIHELQESYESDVEKRRSVENDFIEIEVGEFIDPVLERRRNQRSSRVIRSLLEEL